MLNIVKNKKYSFNESLLTTNYITEKNFIIQNDSEIDENINIIFYPSSSKEWYNNIYCFNKSYLKSLISNYPVLNKLFRSYCNMLPDKIKILYKRRRNNKIRYSANKIYLSRAELNHTNTKLFITLYTYNKQKSSSQWLIRKIITLILFHIVFVPGRRKPIIIPYYKNRIFHLLKNNFFVFKKWNIAFFKPINNLARYFLVNLRKRYLKPYNISTYSIRFLKKSIRLIIKLFNTTKLINFNIYKFNNLKIKSENFSLISLIKKLYNKKVEIQLVELNSVHLNSDVFSSAVALKLRDRQNKAVRVLRKAIVKMVRTPDLHTLITFYDNVKAMNKNNIINTIKQQIVSGVRFEASGRLTRRLTAMRSIFKYRYVGSLKNICSSFNNESSTMLRGYVKSNSQYNIINSKTRNGTFGLKCWVSSHNFLWIKKNIFWSLYN
jgi:Mitochondrial ribosomal protein (VAR1)